MKKSISKPTEPEPDPATSNVHLYRGAPPVRGWSRYKETVRTWTLCGIHRHEGGTNLATELTGEVTCRYCADLMRT